MIKHKTSVYQRSIDAYKLRVKKLQLDMKKIIFGLSIAASLALAISAFASGPAPGTGLYPWRACSAINDITCTSQLGPDLNSDNGIFDCTAPNGKAGIGMFNFDSGKAHCFAL